MKTPATGTKFGRLEFTGNVRRVDKGSYVVTEYECLCECGNTGFYARGNLMSGHTKSCGCFALEIRTTHRLTDSVTYKTWDSMVQRVTNPTKATRKNYFDKGIDMDPRWLSFDAFLSDMGERPDGLTIERRDGTKGYWPWNCEWADRKTQNNNTSRNVFLSVDGVRMTVAQACERYGISRGALSKRLAKGMDVLLALTTPVDARFSRKAQ